MKLLHLDFHGRFSLRQQLVKSLVIVVYFFETAMRDTVISNSQPAITCSNLTIKTLEQGVKYVQS